MKTPGNRFSSNAARETRCSVPGRKRSILDKSQFNEEQIIAILKESESGVEPGRLSQRHGITRRGLHGWKAKNRAMKVIEARRLGGRGPAGR